MYWDDHETLEAIFVLFSKGGLYRPTIVFKETFSLNFLEYLHFITWDSLKKPSLILYFIFFLKINVHSRYIVVLQAV